MGERENHVAVGGPEHMLQQRKRQRRIMVRDYRRRLLNLTWKSRLSDSRTIRNSHPIDCFPQLMACMCVVLKRSLPWQRTLQLERCQRQVENTRLSVVQARQRWREAMVHGEERKEGEGKLGDVVVYPGAASRHAENEWRRQ